MKTQDHNKVHEQHLCKDITDGFEYRVVKIDTSGWVLEDLEYYHEIKYCPYCGSRLD